MRKSTAHDFHVRIRRWTCATFEPKGKKNTKIITYRADWIPLRMFNSASQWRCNRICHSETRNFLQEERRVVFYASLSLLKKNNRKHSTEKMLPPTHPSLISITIDLIYLHVGLFRHLQNASTLTESVSFWAELSSVAACSGELNRVSIIHRHAPMRKSNNDDLCTRTFAVDLSFAFAQGRRLESFIARCASKTTLVPTRASAHHFFGHKNHFTYRRKTERWLIKWNELEK